MTNEIKKFKYGDLYGEVMNPDFCIRVESYRSSTYKTLSRVLSTHHHQYSQVPICEYVWRVSWVTIVVQHTQNHSGLSETITLMKGGFGNLNSKFSFSCVLLFLPAFTRSLFLPFSIVIFIPFSLLSRLYSEPFAF